MTSAVSMPKILLRNITGRDDIPVGSLSGQVFEYKKSTVVKHIRDQHPICVVQISMTPEGEGNIQLQHSSVDAGTLSSVESIVANWQAELPFATSLTYSSCTRSFSASSVTYEWTLGSGALFEIYPQSAPANSAPIKIAAGVQSFSEFSLLNPTSNPLNGDMLEGHSVRALEGHSFRVLEGSSLCTTLMGLACLEAPDQIPPEADSYEAVAQGVDPSQLVNDLGLLYIDSSGSADPQI